MQTHYYNQKSRRDYALFICTFQRKVDARRRADLLCSQQNGYDFTAVNGSKPVITCDKGEMGCRDIDVIRLKDNSFVFIATDLCIVNRMDENHDVNWADISSNGSKFISLWRSDDLVHFSPQELKYFGCIWAPEIFMTRRQTIILSISAQPSRRTIFKKWQFITPKQRILKASPIQNYFLKRVRYFRFSFG